MGIVLASVAANIIERIPLSKKPEDCRIICIPTAVNVETGSKDWLNNELDAFRQAGFDLIMFDLDGATESDVASKLAAADIVYVTGGNSFFLLEKMQACGFETAIRRELERGVLYIGSSAGSIVCCPDIDHVRGMDDPGKASLKTTRGLHLIDFTVMIHMDHPGFAKKAREKVEELKEGFLPIICLTDDQALFIDGTSIAIL